MAHYQPPQHQAVTLRWELSQGNRVWVYLRHSPGDKQTIDSQKAAMMHWCAENGWVVERMFIDEAIEGSKEERPQFQEMMALARQAPRLVDGIVIWSFSRFARSQLDSQFYKADLRKRGFVVVSKIDEIPNNELAPVMEAFVDWKNQRFLDDLSADVKRGLLYLIEQGYWATGVPPIGFRLEKVEIGRRRNGQVRYANHLVKDEAVLERVALAWRMKLQQNASLIDIHDATHLYTRRQPYSLFFDNLLYSGIFELHGKRYPLDWEQGGRFCEPYVSLDEFYKVQENRQKRTIAVIAPRTLSSSYLLTGFLKCGLCAEKEIHATIVGGKDSRSNYRFYRCMTKLNYRRTACSLPSIPCWRLDEPVLQILKDTILTPEYIRVEVERANAMLSQSEHDIKGHLNEATRLVRERQRQVELIIDLIKRKGMTPILEHQYDTANTDWQSATSQLASLQSESAQSRARYLPLLDIGPKLEDIRIALDYAPIPERRELLRRFIDSILVFPDRFEIKFRFRLDSMTSDSAGFQHAYGNGFHATQYARSSSLGSAIGVTRSAATYGTAAGIAAKRGAVDSSAIGGTPRRILASQDTTDECADALIFQ